MPFLGYLLDIEGTTTPVDFVVRTLFPFARSEMPAYIAKHSNDQSFSKLLELIQNDYRADVEAGENPPDWSGTTADEGLLAYLNWQMDRDKKATGLKALQGRIWETGYKDGRLIGEIYEDVWPAVARWNRFGARVCIFSSGSVHAQKLLFSHLKRGDMTHLIHDYFDTTTGSKRALESYAKIADQMGIPAPQICFLSDTREEISAAKKAHMRGVLVIRSASESNYPEYVRSFEDLPN